MNLSRLYAMGLIVAGVGLADAAMAGTVDFAGYTMTTNGTASLNGSNLVLTTDTAMQAGSAFIATPFAINDTTSFTTTFNFTLSGRGADGFTFVIQNAPSGANALGGNGGDLGYAEGGITPSVAVAFPTYRFNDVEIDTNGTVADSGQHFSAVNGTGTATVTYDATTDLLSVLASDSTGSSVNFSTTVNLASLLGSQAYFGFTGATGAESEMHEITGWTLSVDEPSVPEPATLTLMGVGLAALGLARRKRRKEAC